MSTGTKISPRKIKRFIVGSLVLVAFSCVLYAANRKQSEQKITGVQVILNSVEDEEHFLLAKDVEQLFVHHGAIDILNRSVASLNLDQIEHLAETNPWVKNAEVYVDNNSKLNIEVTQRLPVARIFTVAGNSFYVDTSGFEMPLSDRYAYPVPVFTGVRKQASDSIYNSMKRKIVFLAQVLKADSFWNDQITQIEVVNEHSFNGYTTIGKQKIRIGDTTRIHDKLSNLYSFYREVSNKIGWDKYSVLDIRFKGQVVASPSIGWTPPKDTGTHVARQEPPHTEVQTSTAAAPAKDKDKVKPAAQTLATNKPKSANPAPEKKVQGGNTPKPKYVYTNEKNKPNQKKQ